MTNFELEDFREQPPYDNPGPWLTWAVPEKFSLKYMFRLLLWIWIIPMLLIGTTLSPVLMLLQFLIVDFSSYSRYKLTNSI